MQFIYDPDASAPDFVVAEHLAIFLLQVQSYYQYGFFLNLQLFLLVFKSILYACAQSIPNGPDLLMAPILQYGLHACMWS